MFAEGIASALDFGFGSEKSETQFAYFGFEVISFLSQSRNGL
uniref:Uncharacterized protein n=1 Tax=Nelumbo nucifera TaxID=4432 RepID=A0A822YKU1_NELNU|nr:TPA_asm: hypothetical protein HUJ06_010760 [Nelumbo nucifera]